MIRKSALKTVPHRPGVYIYKDAFKKIIYVGKAKSLKDRISYYFQEGLLVGKIKEMMQETVILEWLETVSEADALLLEADFIKKFKPKFNVLLKDDKSYLYIKILKGTKTLEREFPAVLLVRKKEPDSSEYFGPYPNGSSIKAILRLLRKIYQFRDCSPSKFERHRKLERGCLFYDLKLCHAPCVPLLSSRDYKINIRQLKTFLVGKSQKLEQDLRNEMIIKSKNLQFEEAAAIRGKISVLEQIKEIKFRPSDYQNNPNLTSEVHQSELKDLIKFYNENSSTGFLTAPKNFRIETYDVSNTSGREAAASMITCLEGEFSPKDYRKFKIKNKQGPNDYLMIRETLRRRFSHKEWPFPQLLLIDGGLGQVGIAEKVLKEFKINIAIMGLAKRLERPVIGGKYVAHLGNRPGLNLLKRIRDEAHRFAKDYHKLLRLKKMLYTSRLVGASDVIPNPIRE